MSVVMMDDSGLSAHADVRDEVETLRLENEHLTDLNGLLAQDLKLARMGWAEARQKVVALVAALSDGDPEFICDPGHWEFPYTDDPFTPVLTVFAITEDELLTEYQRQYDAWEQESSDD